MSSPDREPAPGLLAALKSHLGEMAPYRVAGSRATFTRGDSLVYVVPPDMPRHYLVDEGVLDELLQADDTFLVLVGAGAAEWWAIPADEAAFLIEGRVPQQGSGAGPVWRFIVEARDGRWLLRAQSNPHEWVDVTAYHNAPPGD